MLLSAGCWRWPAMLFPLLLLPPCLAQPVTPPPSRPTLLDKTATSISIAWTQTPESEGSTPMYMVLLGAATAYTGTSATYTAFGLQSDACYTFVVRVLLEGRGWSADSEPLRVATLAGPAVTMPALEADLAMKRRKIATAALAEMSLDPCPLAGLAHLEYFDGSSTSVSYKGSLDRITEAGTAASVVNCDLAKCSPKYDGTQPYGAGIQGKLGVAAGMDWQLGAAPKLLSRFVAMAPGESSVIYSDAETAARTTLPLLGCRAAPTTTIEEAVAAGPTAAVVLLAVDEAAVAAAAPAAGLASSTAAAAAAADGGGSLLLESGADLLVDAASTPGAAATSAFAARHHRRRKAPRRRRLADRHRFAAAASAGRHGGRGRLPDVSPHRRRTARGLDLVPAGCFEVNCTASAAQYLFCAQAQPPPPSAAGPDAPPAPPPAVAPLLQQAVSWSTAVNYASHGLDAPPRYEVLATVALAPPVADNHRRPRDHGYLEGSPLYREAWALSFLAALPAAGACPHFPLLLDVFQCPRLPGKMTLPPLNAAGGASGALPAHVPGAAALAVARGVRANADSFLWGAVLTDTVQTDLGRVLEAFEAPALPGAWLRGLLLQLVYSLAVARHAFGLHHNGLLSLRHVKLVQVPRGSPAHRAFACYRTTPEVLAGVPVRVRAEADPAAFLSGRGAGGARGFLWEPDAGRDDMDACVRKDGAAAAATAAAGGAAVPAASSRTSWCVATADVDGLSVKLHGYGAASLVRKQLEWWSGGYAFPNTAWRDDLRDLGAASLCPLARERVADFASFAGGALADLCARMAAGEYGTNPAQALLHPLFSSGGAGAADEGAPSSYGGLPAMESIPRSRRLGYTYAPVTLGSDAAAPPAASPAPAAAAASASPAALYPDGAEVSREALLRLLVPRRPWLVHRRSAQQMLVAWAPHTPALPPQLARVAPQGFPVAFTAFVNGVSVYSGAALSHDLRLGTRPVARSATECLRVQVAAFYPSLGWTERSEPLLVNDCTVYVPP